MSRPAILTRTHSLLNAFSSPSTPLPALLSNFTPNDPWALEHGLPRLAPFLGRKYTGLEGLKEYFTLLAETLEIEWMRFEGEGAWVVDLGEHQQGHGDKEGEGEGERKVSLRGEARFKWKSTGQAWEETFAYRIGFVDDEERGGDDVKVKSYEVWADTGAAYLARVGGLDRLS
ncbi:uncharacterized protein LDX57_004412 [Aspergillus melleus]|uniref:uncharacterized protein n=1 Tax=Aspergillus melleus TaxID=138277 RepID=UPI001E8DFDCE|nr:uncharacterized protein LDX57_004412 [Aspergillus melleus]KAH8426678.1 hypothetical protein LDX57_004412 [Aspergillus melleus]